MSGNIIIDIILQSNLPIIYLKVSATRQYVQNVDPFHQFQLFFLLA